MATRREQILAAINTAILPTAGVNGRVYRSRVEPLARQESPAIVVEPTSDNAQQNTSLPTLDWSLTVRVAVIVRGLVPDQLADPIVADMHNRIMADLTLGGVAIDVQPIGTEFEMMEADQPAGVISSNYLVRYRTNVADLSLPGCG
jgi:hypothetical protein